MPAANPCMETIPANPTWWVPFSEATNCIHPNKAQFCCEFVLNFQGRVLKDREEAGCG